MSEPIGETAQEPGPAAAEDEEPDFMTLDQERVARMTAIARGAGSSCDREIGLEPLDQSSVF